MHDISQYVKNELITKYFDEVAKTDKETSQYVVHFWLQYINTLIKIDRDF